MRALNKALRDDIQVLRGLAVLSVLLFHAGFSRFEGGYLGVDIFFVISGYLITKMIAEKRAAGRFSFADFYTRRARRLLPAAYVTFAVTALAAPWFLSADAMQDLYEQILGAISFSANMVLLGQSGYFGSESELKPLLHIWSLSVEEQYYFLLPGFLVLLNRRFWLPTLLLGTALSFGVYVWKNEATYAFYILPTRAWEMGFGSVVALVALDERSRARIASLSWLYWPLLVAVPVVAVDFMPAPYAALVACALTALLIISGPSEATAKPWLKPMRWSGDISYSLYLAHWPAIAFFNNSWFGPINEPKPVTYQLGLLALAFVFAIPLHYLVEKPIHLANDLKGRRLIAGGIGGAAIIAALALLYVKPAADDPALTKYAGNFGLSADCGYGPEFTDLPQCRTSASPTVLLWGDSYAMQWVDGLKASQPDIAFIQATRSACAPILDLAVMNAGDRDTGWSLDCVSFNRTVFDAIARYPTITTVVLAGNLDRHASGKFRGVIPNEASREGTIVALTPERTRDALEQTVRRIHALGKRVVLLGPMPSSGVDVVRCDDRRAQGQVVLGAPADCAMSKAEVLRQRGPAYALLDAVAARSGAAVVSPFSMLCDGQSCARALDGVSLYRDPGHLSFAGSKALGQRMQISRMIDSLAR